MSLKKSCVMETAMRAQREKVQLLKEGDGDKDDILNARCKYQAMLDEYKEFSSKFKLPEQRERIYYDLQGRVAPYTARKFTVSNEVSDFTGEGGKKISASGTLHAVGDPIFGKFDTVTKEFTEGDFKGKFDEPDTTPEITE